MSDDDLELMTTLAPTDQPVAASSISHDPLQPPTFDVLMTLPTSYVGCEDDNTRILLEQAPPFGGGAFGDDAAASSGDAPVFSTDRLLSTRSTWARAASSARTAPHGVFRFFLGFDVARYG